MELKEFISQSIISMIDGVAEAQAYAKEHEAQVNPNINNIRDVEGITSDVRNRYMQVISFDIAVTVSENESGKAGVGIMVAALGLGVQYKAEGEESRVSRLKFSIPVMLPKQ